MKADSLSTQTNTGNETESQDIYTILYSLPKP